MIEAKGKLDNKMYILFIEKPVFEKSFTHLRLVNFFFLSVSLAPSDNKDNHNFLIVTFISLPFSLSLKLPSLHVQRFTSSFMCFFPCFVRSYNIFFNRCQLVKLIFFHPIKILQTKKEWSSYSHYNNGLANVEKVAKSSSFY